MKYFRFLLVICALFLSTVSHAQELATIVNADSLRPGDVFEVTIVLKKFSPETTIIEPDSAQFGENFEVRSVEKFSPNQTTDSIVYHLQFFGVGDVQLDGYPFTIQKSDGSTLTRSSDIVPIFYKQQVPEDAASDEPKPLKDIYNFSIVWWPWLVGLTLLLLLSYFLWRYYLRKKAEREAKPAFVPQAPAPFVDPLAVLQTSLKQLKSSDALTQGDFKSFYTELGDSLRMYLESMYDIDALESTGNEVLQKMERKRLDPSLIQKTREILNAAELVKFAKFVPSLDSAYSDLNRGYEFYERAKVLDSATVQRLREEYRERLELTTNPKEGDQA